MLKKLLLEKLPADNSNKRLDCDAPKAARQARVLPSLRDARTPRMIG